jgi:hypothetical protein
MRTIVRNAIWFVHSLVVYILIRTVQVVLFLFALFCLFAVLEQLVDEGGGASGLHARRLVTVIQRILLATIFGSLGILSAVGASRLKRYLRRMTTSVIPAATKPANGTFEPSPLWSGVWDRELDTSV